MRTAADEIVLQATGLRASYGRVAVLHEISLQVRAGQVVALLGPNGAGKSTTLLALSGELPITAGEIRQHGVTGAAPLYTRAAAGLAFSGDRRSIFTTLTTAENIRVSRCDPRRVQELFPELAKCMSSRAGLLSGGEQQMLALGTLLARKPRLLLADELSLGLAPIVTNRLLRAIRDAADQDGLGALLVEQHVPRVLEIADYVYVLNRGRMVLEGTVDNVRGRLAELESAYLGTAIAAKEGLL